ncbi:MAG: PhnE/PtxC family ABC transporter permease, partial [bacterium]
MSASTLRRRAFPLNWSARATALGLFVYAIYALGQLDITWARLIVGLGEVGRFLARLLPPNFSRTELLIEGLLESLQIAVIASALGIVLALPLGLMAARNLAPWTLAVATRACGAFCRSLHDVMVAIVFVWEIV